MGLGLSAAVFMYRRRRKVLDDAEVLIIEGSREIKTDLLPHVANQPNPELSDMPLTRAPPSAALTDTDLRTELQKMTSLAFRLSRGAHCSTVMDQAMRKVDPLLLGNDLH